MSYHRQRPGQAWLWGLTVLLFLLFGALTAYQLIARDRDRAEAEKQAAAAPVLVPPPIEMAAADEAWPQWRGPRRDGISTETDLAADWPERGLPKIWEQPDGEGFASVVVARGRAFSFAQDGDDEALFCWDAATGKEHWRFAYPCRYTNSFGNGPRATPTIAGELIYIVGATGLMHCLTAFTETPTVVWHKALLSEFAAPVPQWGVAFSPLIDGDLVYIQPGGPAGNSVAALHKDTGAVVWKNCDYPASYSSPMAGTLAGRRQIVSFTGTHLIGVTPEAGELLWEFPWPTANLCNIATPILAGDYVFISSGYEMGCALVRIERSGADWRAQQVYKNRRFRNHFSTSVLYQNHLYGFDDATLVCMEFGTGKILWKERGFERGSLLVVQAHELPPRAAATALVGAPTLLAAPAVLSLRTEGQLIVYGANGLLALAAAAPGNYAERARFYSSPQRASCWSMPSVAQGRLYVRDQKKLICYDVKARW
jgi:outer membrane protein assembly factor BamB